MTRIALVTGAAGFTGRYVVEALRQKQYRVIALGSRPEEVGDEWISCDLTDQAQVRATVTPLAPEYVVHLAAVSFVGHDKEEDFYRTNVIGTSNLLSALSEGSSKPRKILLASSANVYGRCAEQPFTEDACPAPVNHYAASKLAMEHLARNWFDCLPIVITRPFNYTGPGQSEKFIVPKLVAHFRARKNSIHLGNVTAERDFMDVDDLVEAYIRLLSSEACGEIVNICTGSTLSVSRIVEYLSEIAGYKIRVEIDPDLVRPADIPKLRGSSEKLARLTGFRPQRPFVETLRRMCKYPGDARFEPL